MSDKDNRINKLDLTSDMTDEWDNELDESELSNPEDVEIDNNSINSSQEDSQNLPDKLVEEDDEDDEDDDEKTESGSLLSTTSGKILVGASLFGASVIGFGGYIMLSALGSAVSTEVADVTPANIKPIYGEATTIETKPDVVTQVETKPDVITQVEAKPDVITQVEANPDFIAQVEAKEPEIKIDFNAVKIENKNPIIDKVEDKKPEVKIDFNNLPDNNSTVVTQVVSPNVEEKRFNISLLNKESVKPVTEIVKSTNLPSEINSGFISKDEVSTLVENIVSESSIDDKNKISNLESKVEELSLLEEKFKNLQKLVNEHSKKEIVVQKIVEKSDTKASLVDSSKLSRERLKGFEIINTTMDGSMSVVKAPSGRTIILYKGESFYVKGKGSFVVNDVLNGGKLLLANKHYFIDNVYEKPLVVKEIKKKSISLKKKVKLVLPEENVINVVPDKKLTEKYSNVNVAKLADNIKIQSNKKIAKQFTWNGQMGNEFIIQMPNGEWEVVKAGDEVEGLGIVNGLSDDESLIIGDFVVEKSKD